MPTTGIPSVHSRDHVLATTTGLVADDHTVSGLTARQVLIASSATDALFRAIEEADLPHTYTSVVTLNGGISSSVADGASAKAFHFTDTISRTQADTIYLENTSLSRILMRTSWDGRFSFGYSASLAPQTGHVLGFLQQDTDSPTGAPHMVGILSLINHNDSTETISQIAGLIGVGILTTTTGLTPDHGIGVSGVAACGDDTTGLSSKILAGVRGHLCGQGSFVGTEPTTGISGLTINLGVTEVPQGDWGYGTAFFAPCIYSSSAKGLPTNRPDVMAGGIFCIPGWSATTGEQWGAYVPAPNPSGSITPAVGGGIYVEFPERGTRKTHIYCEPTAAAASGPTGAAAGDEYTDDGTNNGPGKYEYRDSQWCKLSNDYGEIYVEGNTTATTISVQNTWYQVTIFDTNGQSRGTTPDHTNDHITIRDAGVYLVTVSFSFSGGGSKTYEAEVQKNNGATGLTNLHAERKLGAAGDIGSASISGLASFSASDTVEFWIRCTDAVTADATIRDVNLSVVRVS